MKTIGRVKICGQRHDVVRVSNEEDPEMEENFGRYDPENSRLVIGNGMTKDTELDTVIHEVLHALLNCSGARDITRLAFSVSKEDPRFDAWEETLISALTPHVKETFKLRMEKP